MDNDKSSPAEITAAPTEDNVNNNGRQYMLAQRAQALALISANIHISEVIRLTKMPRSAIYSIRRRAIKRGYDPKVDTRIFDSYLVSAHRSGRPRKDQKDGEKVPADSPAKG